jgi:hypothetical protein
MVAWGTGCEVTGYGIFSYDQKKVLQQVTREAGWSSENAWVMINEIIKTRENGYGVKSIGLRQHSVNFIRKPIHMLMSM